MARTFRKPNRDNSKNSKQGNNRTIVAAAKAARMVNKFFPPSNSSSAFREFAVLAVVVGITVFVFLGILRTRDDTTVDSGTKAEVERIEKMIQQRLQEMAKGVKAKSHHGGDNDGDGVEITSDGKSVKQRKGSGKPGKLPNVFKHFEPSAKHPLTSEELDELKADIHGILGGSIGTDGINGNGHQGSGETQEADAMNQAAEKPQA